MGVTIRHGLVLCAATSIACFGCSTDLRSPDQEPGSGATPDSAASGGDSAESDSDWSDDRDGAGSGTSDTDSSADGGDQGPGDTAGDSDGTDDGGPHGGDDGDGADGGDHSSGDDGGGPDGGDDTDGADGGDHSSGDGDTDPIFPIGMGAPWHVVHHAPEFLAGVHAKDRYILVGPYGGIWSALDGSTWTQADVDFRTALEDIAVCNDKLIAVGESSVRSVDGLVWENIETPEPLRRICCNGTEFVALSDANIYTSVDGAAWNDVADHEWSDRDGWNVAYDSWIEHHGSPAARLHCAPGHHVLVINNDLYHAHTPENWSVVSGYSYEFRDVAFGDGMLVAVAWRPNGHDVESRFWTSADGETWSPIADTIFSTLLSRIFWDGEQFVALGEDVYTSPDATTWTRSIEYWDLDGNWFPGPIPSEILVGPDATLAVTPHETWLGADVSEWSRSFLHRAVGGVHDVALGDGAILAAQSQGAFFYTTDPLSWGSPSPAQWEGDYHSRVTYGPAGWALTGFGPLRLGQPGAFTEHGRPDLRWSIRGLAADSERYVAVGYRSDWATSPDGVRWRVGKAHSEYTYALAGYYLNSEFWMVGGLSQQTSGYPAADDVSFLARSSDGADWQVVETGGTEPLYSLAYGDGRYIAVGRRGVVLVSDNGESWAQHSLGDTWIVDSIAFNGNHFVAVHYGELWASYDGEIWERLPQPEGVPNGLTGLKQVLAVDGHFVGFGSRELIVTTTAP